MTFTRSLGAAFAAIVICFIAATAVAQLQLYKVDKDAMDIARNGSPSVHELASARGELSRLHLLIGNRVEDGLPGDGAEVAETRKRFTEHVDRYLELPIFPQEQRHHLCIARRVGQLEAAIDATVAKAAAGDGAGASALLRGDLARAFDAAREAIQQASDFNAAHVADLALDIEGHRRRNLYLVGGLDALCALVAAVTAWVVIRSVRRHTELLATLHRLSAERAAHLDEFAGRVAHDVLGSLTPIQLCLELRGEHVPPDPKEARLVEGGLRSLRRVRTIVDGLLEFARAGAEPRPEARADVRSVLDDVLSGLEAEAAEAGVDLAVEPGLGGDVVCSEGVLTSLVGNLARNAVKYIDGGRARRVRARVLDRGDAVRIEVEDTGPGIPLAVRERLFDPYVRGVHDERKPGIGLGLATVKRLAEAHGGAVGARSEPGEGSLFWVELPKAREPAAQASLV
jgi:signal transduction histidine kinase